MHARILIVIFLVLLPFTAFAGSSGDIWVALRVHDRALGEGISEYYGRIEKGQFDVLTNTQGLQAFIKLEDVVSSYDGRIVPMEAELDDAGLPLGYSKTVYLRADTIVRIVLLSDQHAERIAETRSRSDTKE